MPTHAPQIARRPNSISMVHHGARRAYRRPERARVRLQLGMFSLPTTERFLHPSRRWRARIRVALVHVPQFSRTRCWFTIHKIAPLRRAQPRRQRKPSQSDLANKIAVAGRYSKPLTDSRTRPIRAAHYSCYSERERYRNPGASLIQHWRCLHRNN